MDSMHNPIVKYSNTNINDKQMDGFDGQPLLSNIPNIQIQIQIQIQTDSCQTVANIQE